MLTAIYDFWYAALQDEIAAGNKEGWAHTFSFLNLFGYVTFRAATAGLLAFGISVLIGPRIIRKLISLKVGQPIRTAEEVHKLAELHGGKIGTPTMGGVLIIASVLIATFFCARIFNPFVAVCACTMCACGLLGFVDDYTNEKKKNSDGVSSRTKLFWQFVIALIAASFIYFKTEISGFGATAAQISDGAAGFRLGDQRIGIGDICFPLLKIPLVNLGILVIPFFILIIIGCSNAVNLTDGLDGLATGCTISVALSYAVLAYLAGHFFMATEYLVIPHNRYIAELSVFMMALAGASFGFLWFNSAPRRSARNRNFCW
jgi:phospho-N-acetylmuramoyl-pentapeptide-transferase